MSQNGAGSWKGTQACRRDSTEREGKFSIKTKSWKKVWGESRPIGVGAIGEKNNKKGRKKA